MNLSGTPLTLVTNQISSMFSGLSKNLRVDVNYRPATAETSSEFDVGLSTQFLDDRLLIDGTFGMLNNRNTTLEQASTIVGDINIQYAITTNRQLWVRVFNRTNTVDILDNKAPYTQGVGLSYQRNFSSLRELFSGKKKDKNKNKTDN